METCYFPFKYNSVSYDTCINIDSPNGDYWCSLTADYDRDKKRGKCNSGFTSNTIFDVCRLKFRKFTCPKDYLIYIVSAEWVVTSDSSCDYT
jgi:hypothetical protein